MSYRDAPAFQLGDTDIMQRILFADASEADGFAKKWLEEGRRLLARDTTAVVRAEAAFLALLMVREWMSFSNYDEIDTVTLYNIPKAHTATEVDVSDALYLMATAHKNPKFYLRAAFRTEDSSWKVTKQQMPEAI